MTIVTKSSMLTDCVEKVCLALRSSRYAEVRRVEGGVNNGFLVLTGAVSSFYLKQVVQNLLFQRFSYSLPLINDLRVIAPESEPFRHRPR